MSIRLAGVVLLVGAVGCSKPADTNPTPSPVPGVAPPDQKQPSNTNTVPPKAGGAADTATEERAVKYLEKVGGRYRRTDYGAGDSISHIYLMGAKATDEEIRAILLPTLRYIDFGETPVTDETLKQLRSCPHLSNLSVSSPKVTDAGVAHLAGVKTLFSLNLTGCKQVTVGGVKHLTPLPELIDVVLTDTGVTDDGVKELKTTMPKWVIMK